MVSVAGWATLILVIIVVVVALIVARKARDTIPGGYAEVYGVRKYYASALVLGLGLTLTVSLPQTPYSALLGSEPSVRVDVLGQMWSWQMRQAGDDAPKTASPLVLPSGKIVEFAVTAKDVNHGFGIYDDGGHLLAQTQAMPGYVNRLRYVFDVPGHYHVACLEYCGLMHHAMLSKITVQ